MGVLHTPSRHTFECDGTQRVFPIPSYIISQDYVRMEIDGILVSNRREWDVVNNSIVFVTAPLAGLILDVQVASDSESLGELGMISNVDILAQNITNVNKVAEIDLYIPTVANIDTDVTKVANIDSDVTKVANIDTGVTKVANIDLDVTKVANIDSDVSIVSGINTKVTTVADNILDVQNAEENALIAKEEAWKAEAERLTAKSYATEPENDFVKVYTSNNDGTFTITNTTDYSALHWEKKAGSLVSSGVIDDTTPSLARTYSSSKINSELQTIEGSIDTIEGNIDTIEGNILSIEGNIDTIEWSISTLEGSVSSLDNNKLSKTGGVMTGSITAIRETKVAMDTDNIDLATGNLFTKTITVATTLTVSNVLPEGNANSFILELTNGGSKVITWWSGMKWAGGTAPTLTASGVDILGFYSHDGGTTWRGMVMTKDSK